MKKGIIVSILVLGTLIASIALTGCAMYLTVTDKMQVESFIGIYSAVITYYFTRKQ